MVEQPPPECRYAARAAVQAMNYTDAAVAEILRQHTHLRHELHRERMRTHKLKFCFHGITFSLGCGAAVLFTMPGWMMAIWGFIPVFVVEGLDALFKLG